MIGTEIESEPAPKPGQPAWLRVIVLLTIVGLLFYSTYVRMRGDRAEKSGTEARLLIDSLTASRQVFYNRNSSLAGFSSDKTVEEEEKLIVGLRKLAAIDPAPNNVRHLALMQYEVESKDWQTTLSKLRDAPNAGSPVEVERELAMWRVVLSGKPLPSQVASFRSIISAMQMGWYQHVALYALYRNAAMSHQAETEKSAAFHSVILLMLATLVMMALSFLGLCLLIVGTIVWFTQRHLLRSLPAFLQPAVPQPLSRDKADISYQGFILYLAMMAVLSWISPALFRPLLRNMGLGTNGLILFSTALNLCIAFIPLGIMLKMGKPCGLTLAHIGYRSHSPLGDVAWGLAGYVAALPILLGIAFISNALFWRVDTPINPAITEFAGGGDMFYKVMLFFQASMMAPFIEETMFRGVFYNALASRMNRVLAAITVAAVFALLHPQLPIGFLGIFALGLLFNTLYVLRGSLYPCMVAHAVNNAGIFILLAITLGS